METVLVILCALVAGVIGGMGMGGGTLLIPLLNIFFGIKQHTAQAANLAVFIPMSIVALAVHIKKKLIDFKKALNVAIPATLTAVAGSFAAKSLNSASLQKYFGVFLILIAVFQVTMFILQKCKNKVK
jgi:uncharacterized membrane protein YfcA